MLHSSITCGCTSLAFLFPRPWLSRPLPLPPSSRPEKQGKRGQKGLSSTRRKARAFIINFRLKFFNSFHKNLTKIYICPLNPSDEVPCFIETVEAAAWNPRRFWSAGAVGCLKRTHCRCMGKERAMIFSITDFTRLITKETMVVTVKIHKFFQGKTLVFVKENGLFPGKEKM